MLDKLFKKHPEFVLTALAVLFAVIIAASYFFGIALLIKQLGAAIGAGAEESGIGATFFDIKGAAELDLKVLGP